MKLFIDSSTAFLYLAVVNNDQVDSFVRLGKCDHSETLVDFLNQFLKDQNLDVSNIDEVYIGRGPGSYTGLRIAGTVGKMFAYLRDIKLYSFSSLDVYLCASNGNIISRIDAKKNHSYAKIIKNNQIILDDSFVENTEFEKYPDYMILEASEEFFNQYQKMIPIYLLNNHLYQEESVMDYSPNYIRSGI